MNFSAAPIQNDLLHLAELFRTYFRPQIFILFTLIVSSPALAKEPQSPATLPSSPTPEKIFAETALGRISGKYVNLQTGLATFQGIPYAEPPVGELRWRPPQAAQPWQTTLDCTTFGPAAPQKPITDHQDEDCLKLNIWTKKTGQTDAELPVMVWIHGGGLNKGSGHQPQYDGSNFAKKDVVLVTINYRLGALGFLAHPALSAESPFGDSGNYGILDQIESLKWIRNNIRFFGGDPDNVTIFGESAGGTSVSVLCCSPMAKSLFHRAIIQSPWMFGFVNNLAEPNFVPLNKSLATTLSAEKLGQQWAATLSPLRGKPLLDYLRSLEPPELLKTIGYYSTRVTTGHRVLADHPSNLFAKGQQTDVPILMGTNRDEGMYFAGWVNIPTREKWIAKLSLFYGEATALVAAAYPGDSPRELKAAGCRFITDSWFLQPTRSMLKGMDRIKSPGFQYLFTRANHQSPSLGSPHAIELRYVFNTLKDAGKRPLDQKLAGQIVNYWVQFSKTGNPNGNGLPKWPEYDTQKKSYLELNHQIQIRHNLNPIPSNAIDQAWERVYGPTNR